MVADTVQTMNDIIRIVRKNPEVRDELRRVLLTDELLEMPQRLASLVTVVTQQGDDIAELKTDVAGIKTDMASLKGFAVESAVQGRILRTIPDRLNVRRSRAVRGPNLPDIAHEFEEAVENSASDGAITPAQRTRIFATDLIVRARKRDTGVAVYVPVEASFTLDQSDIDRAAAAAAALARVFPDAEVTGAVYGVNISRQDAETAERVGVQVFQDQLPR